MPAPLQPVPPSPVRTAKRRRRISAAVAMGFVLVACLGLIFYRRPAIALVLVVCGASVFYWRPLWIINQCIRAWLRIFGVRSRYVQLGSFRIHFLTGGRGRPVVLVHGLGGWAENWVTLMPALMRHGYRVYAIDLLGFGRSDRPDVDYSITLQARVLNDFFGSQKLACADLGGWSMGGWVAMKFALTHPERVSRIFIADSPGIDLELPFDPALFQPVTVDQAQQLLALLTPQGRLIPRFVARDVVRRIRPRKWIVERSLKSMMARGDLLDSKLREIRAPVLIVWGKQDAIIPLQCGEQMHRQIPQSVLAIFDGCGHLAPVEDGDRLLPEILHFLEAEPPLLASAHEFPQ